MANPIPIEIPEGAWKLIDGGQIIGTLYVLDTSFRYYKTYVPERDTPPSNIDPTDLLNFPGIRIFDGVIEDKLSFKGRKDLYVLCFNADDDSDDSGKVLYFSDEDKSGKAVDAALQDQTTPVVEHFLYNVLNNITLANPVTLGDNTIDLVAGHLVVAEDFINISYIDETQNVQVRFYQARVISILADTVTMAIPVPFDIVVANIERSERITVDLNVVGSLGSPVKFETQPPDGLDWDITRVMPVMITAGQPDDGKFGDLPFLVNGMYFGFEGGNFTEYNVNVVANAGFRATAYDVEYTSRSVPAGSYGVSVRKTFAGQSKMGVAIRLEGQYNDRFVAVVQDDLSGLTEFRMKVMGHVVD